MILYELNAMHCVNSTVITYVAGRCSRSLSMDASREEWATVSYLSPVYKLVFLSSGTDDLNIRNAAASQVVSRPIMKQLYLYRLWAKCGPSCMDNILPSMYGLGVVGLRQRHNNNYWCGFASMPVAVSDLARTSGLWYTYTQPHPGSFHPPKLESVSQYAIGINIKHIMPARVLSRRIFLLKYILLLHDVDGEHRCGRKFCPPGKSVPPDSFS